MVRTVRCALEGGGGQAEATAVGSTYDDLIIARAVFRPGYIDHAKGAIFAHNDDTWLNSHSGPFLSKAR